MLTLASLIKTAYKNNGIITAYIYGEFGYGKTSYALWVAYDVYGDWSKALANLHFSPRGLLSGIRSVISDNKRIPLIIMDDAGLWLDRLTWWEKDKVNFMKLFNLVRSITAGIIFTTPSEELPRQIINKCFLRVWVSIASPEEVPLEHLRGIRALIGKYRLGNSISVARGYSLKTLPSFFRFVKKQFIDYYPTHYPVYKEYERKRREAIKHYYYKLLEVVEQNYSEAGKEHVYSYIRRELRRGTPIRDIARTLISLGIPRSTAYYYIKRVRTAIEQTT